MARPSKGSALPNGYSPFPIGLPSEHTGSVSSGRFHLPHPPVSADHHLNISQSGTSAFVTIDNHLSDERAKPPLYDGDHKVENRLAFEDEYRNYVNYVSQINASKQTKLQIFRRFECIKQNALEMMLQFQMGHHVFNKDGTFVKQWADLVDDYLQVKGVYGQNQFMSQDRALNVLLKRKFEFHNVSDFQKFLREVKKFYQQYGIVKTKGIEGMLCQVMLRQLQPKNLRT